MIRRDEIGWRGDPGERLPCDLAFGAITVAVGGLQQYPTAQWSDGCFDVLYVAFSVPNVYSEECHTCMRHDPIRARTHLMPVSSPALRYVKLKSLQMPSSEDSKHTSQHMNSRTKLIIFDSILSRSATAEVSL